MPARVRKVPAKFQDQEEAEVGFSAKDIKAGLSRSKSQKSGAGFALGDTVEALYFHHEEDVGHYYPGTVGAIHEAGARYTVDWDDGDQHCREQLAANVRAATGQKAAAGKKQPTAKAKKAAAPGAPKKSIAKAENKTKNPAAVKAEKKKSGAAAAAKNAPVKPAGSPSAKKARPPSGAPPTKKAKTEKPKVDKAAAAAARASEAAAKLAAKTLAKENKAKEKKAAREAKAAEKEAAVKKKQEDKAAALRAKEEEKEAAQKLKAGEKDRKLAAKASEKEAASAQRLKDKEEKMAAKRSGPDASDTYGSGGSLTKQEKTMLMMAKVFRSLGTGEYAPPDVLLARYTARPDICGLTTLDITEPEGVAEASYTNALTQSSPTATRSQGTFLTDCLRVVTGTCGAG